MAIYIKTDMEEFPENCLDCPAIHCTLPYKKNTYKDEVKKAYLSKRHEDCPLVEKEDD